MEELNFAGVEYFVDVLVLASVTGEVLMVDWVVAFGWMLEEGFGVAVEGVLGGLAALLDEGSADDDAEEEESVDFVFLDLLWAVNNSTGCKLLRHGVQSLPFKNFFF